MDMPTKDVSTESVLTEAPKMPKEHLSISTKLVHLFDHRAFRLSLFIFLTAILFLTTFYVAYLKNERDRLEKELKQALKDVPEAEIKITSPSITQYPSVENSKVNSPQFDEIFFTDKGKKYKYTFPPECTTGKDHLQNPDITFFKECTTPIVSIEFTPAPLGYIPDQNAVERTKIINNKSWLFSEDIGILDQGDTTNGAFAHVCYSDNDTNYCSQYRMKPYTQEGQRYVENILSTFEKVE